LRTESAEPAGFGVHLGRAANGVLWGGLLFWRIDREIAGAAARGWLGPIPRPVVLGLTAGIAGYYVALALAGVAGLFLRPAEDRLALALVLSVVAVLFAVHAFSVGHSRYHIPVMPLLAVFAARLWTARGQPILGRHGGGEPLDRELGGGVRALRPPRRAPAARSFRAARRGGRADRLSRL
jgi:hypothetical protein